MKLAFVYDKVVKFGGAERILLALNELYPDAPLFTSLFDKKNAKWANAFKIIPSFLNKIPLINNHQELTSLLAPFAFESFDFSDFDIVVSVSSQDAKSIITNPNTLHVNYCLTPTRYLWSGFDEYYRQPALGIFNPLIRIGMQLSKQKLRSWDLVSARRPDIYLAISKNVKNRIKNIYQVNSEVIYPPVDTQTFYIKKGESKNDFFLIVSRLVPYKRIDYAITAFNKLGYPLKIIGSGIDRLRLQNLADKNVEFVEGNLTDQKLCWYYQNCSCLVFPGVEDFGLTPLEAQSCGKPVIALNEGGVTETVIQNRTGLLYNQKSEQSLITAIKKFSTTKFNPDICRNNALNFSKIIFQQKFEEKIKEYYIKFRQRK